MAIKKVSAKHSRKADRRRSQRLSTKRGGPRSGISARKAHPGPRAARRRIDEGVTQTTASPYPEFQREYTSALWL